jgi:hypothetical protein
MKSSNSLKKQKERSRVVNLYKKNVLWKMVVFTVVIISVMLLACEEAFLNDEHDDFNDPLQTEHSIINGTAFSPEESGFVLFSGCSGTLLNNEWVLSAAHCFGNSSTGVSARMGSQSRRVKRVVKHPHLDAALVQLDMPMRMDDSTTGYEMELYHGDASAIEGTRVNCYGYGFNTFTSGFGTLRTADLEVAKVGSTGIIRLEPNANGQIPWEGDSGSSCIYNPSGLNPMLIGVQYMCNYTASTSTVNYCAMAPATEIWAWSRGIMENIPLNEIVFRHSGKCVDVEYSSTSNRANVSQYTRNSTTNQRFRFIPVGGDYYMIQALHSTKCLDVEQSITSNGANILQFTCYGTDNQLFQRIKSGSYDLLRAKHSNKCIDVEYSSKSDGANISQYTCYGTTNQQMTIY